MFFHKGLTPMNKRITEELNEVNLVQCVKILLKPSEYMKRLNSVPGLLIEIMATIAKDK